MRRGTRRRRERGAAREGGVTGRKWDRKIVGQGGIGTEKEWNRETLGQGGSRTGRQLDRETVGHGSNGIKYGTLSPWCD